MGDRLALALGGRHDRRRGGELAVRRARHDLILGGRLLDLILEGGLELAHGGRLDLRLGDRLGLSLGDRLALSLRDRLGLSLGDRRVDEREHYGCV